MTVNELKLAADVAALKQSLQRFANQRATKLPAIRPQLEAEIGELLLTLLRLSDQLDVDLITAAEQRLEQRAQGLPRLVVDASKSGAGRLRTRGKGAAPSDLRK